MIETNNMVDHLAGIIPIAGPPLTYNMPWHDSLMPLNDDYHAIERAVHSATVAGCNTIWIVMHREAQPIIRKKIGEWAYDPETTWKNPFPWMQLKQIPIYYVCVNAKDRKRRDSLGWSCLYGAKTASYTSKKISKWMLPKRFLVISPYGVFSEEVLKNNRDTLKGNKEILFSYDNVNFLQEQFMPFTFNQEQYDLCLRKFKEDYTGKDLYKSSSEIFNSIDYNSYSTINLEWYYDISNWNNYKKFISSDHNNSCTRPKYMLTHSWHGLIDDR